MKVVVLAGGVWSRLWPLSTDGMPKQFLKLYGDKSLLTHTVERFADYECFVSTHRDYVQMSQDHIPWVACIAEPARRNTAPAIVLSALYLRDIAGASLDEVVLFTPADHYIAPQERLLRSVEQASHFAEQGSLVLFGIQPTYPETGYGYIKASANQGIVPVDQFVEKPDYPTAKRYYESWNYYRNAGMFAVKLGVLLDACQSFGLIDSLALSYQEYYDSYESQQSISIDYALLEKMSGVLVCPLTLHWSDLGSRDAVYAINAKDTADNVVIGDASLARVRGSLVYSTISGLKLNDLERVIVVANESGIYMTQRWKSQGIKEVL